MNFSKKQKTSVQSYIISSSFGQEQRNFVAKFSSPNGSNFQRENKYSSPEGIIWPRICLFDLAKKQQLATDFEINISSAMDMFRRQNLSFLTKRYSLATK